MDKCKQVGPMRLSVAAFTFLVIALGFVGVFGAWFFHRRVWLPVAKTDDQLVIVGTGAAVASFFLVVMAGLVALLAYWVATGPPILGLRVVFGGSEVNRPILLAADEVGPAGELTVANTPEATAHVTITNKSIYSARNPGLRIELSGLTGLPGIANWAQVSSPKDGTLIAVQWDGGANFIIHGNWERELPYYNLVGVRTIPGKKHELKITVVADGVPPREWRIPVKVLQAAAYEAHMNGGEAQ